MKTFLKTITPVLLIVTSAFAADKVIIMDDPTESLKARMELIMTATKTIDVQYFTIEHDYVSIAALALLRDRARNNVKIRLIVDSMHNLMTREMMGAFMDNLDPNAKKNIEIREFNNFNLFKPLCYSRRMHDKSLIIDGQYLIVGDRNVASGYYDIPETEKGKQMPSYQGVDVLLAGSKSIAEATKYFNDRWISKDVKPVRLFEYSDTQLDYSYCNYSASESDPLACELRRQDAVKKVKIELLKLDQHFAAVATKSTALIKYRPILNELSTAFETNDVRFIHDDATTRVCKGKNPEKNIAKTLYETIAQNTTNDLIIITPYLIVTPEMELLIKGLVEKNVTVRFLTNSIASNDVPSASAAYLATRNRLMSIKNKAGASGVGIYEFTNITSPTLNDAYGTVIKQGKAIGTVHAKVVIMDNRKIFIGSYNWDYRSQNLNSEVGVLIGLTETKLSGPAIDLRNRVSHLLRNGKLVRADGSTDGEYKSTVELNLAERAEIDTIIASRRESVKTAKKILAIPILGKLYLEQQ